MEDSHALLEPDIIASFNLGEYGGKTKRQFQRQGTTSSSLGAWTLFVKGFLYGYFVQRSLQREEYIINILP